MARRKGIAKKWTGLLVLGMIGIIGAGVSLGVGAVTPVPAPESSEVQQLRKEITALRQRVETLETWQKQVVAAGVTREPTHYWSKGEVNGMPVYVLPLDGTHRVPSEATKQVPANQPQTAPTDNAAKP
jgi:hypothetical protein